jgi:hypothetical protein
LQTFAHTRKQHAGRDACGGYRSLTAAVARSSIVAAFPTARGLPAGYGEIDVAILDWIAAQSVGRSSFVRM